jgi:hypothetical protein
LGVASQWPKSAELGSRTAMTRRSALGALQSLNKQRLKVRYAPIVLKKSGLGGIEQLWRNND